MFVFSYLNWVNAMITRACLQFLYLKYLPRVEKLFLTLIYGKP